MRYIDIKFIENFLEEIEALYEADDGDHYPEYIKDMLLSARYIITNEEAEDR